MFLDPATCRVSFPCLRRLAACVGLTLWPWTLAADVKLAKVFSDHLVLQHGRPVNVWGTADPGEAVTVTFADQSAAATTDDKGAWRLALPPLAPSAEPRELKVAGKNAVALKDVLVGDVWICSGQSNMEWSVKASAQAQTEIPAAQFPQLRFLTIPRKKGAGTRLADFDGAWTLCTPDSVPTFSAVAYFFGRELHQHRKIPIGLIHASWGGTPAEFWTPPAVFEADPTLKQTSNHPHAQNVMKEAGTLFNGMLAPVIPYTLAGAIWYQGESNVPMGLEYRKLFPAMIQGWRQEWGQGDFPFLYVQIAPWKYDRIPGWPREGCPLVREAQLKALRVPQTAMVVTMDIGNVDDIHPTNKQEVGRRLALAARALAYREPLVYSGPNYKSHRVDGNKVVVEFDHVGAGLECAGDKLTHFQIAGQDLKFVAAQAEIAGETVVVSSPDVAAPMAVRYAWQDDAVPNLRNKDGLPASPFRTDGE